MVLGQTRRVTLACSSPCFMCGPRPLIPHFGFSRLGSPWLGDLFWMGLCQVIVLLVPALQKVWRKGLWSRQVLVFCVRLRWTALRIFLHIFLTYTNYIHLVEGHFHGCSLPQQVWLKRSRKHVQDRNKGSHPQSMLLGLRGGPGRHPRPGEDRLPSPFSGVHSGGQEPVLHRSSTVIFWARDWKPRADPQCGGCPAGVIPAGE